LSIVSLAHIQFSAILPTRTFTSAAWLCDRHTTSSARTRALRWIVSTTTISGSVGDLKPPFCKANRVAHVSSPVCAKSIRSASLHKNNDTFTSVTTHQPCVAFFSCAAQRSWHSCCAGPLSTQSMPLLLDAELTIDTVAAGQCQPLKAT
jgi:hypothetical protein